jgi:hypothetical protein
MTTTVPVHVGAISTPTSRALLRYNMEKRFFKRFLIAALSTVVLTPFVFWAVCAAQESEWRAFAQGNRCKVLSVSYAPIMSMNFGFGKTVNLYHKPVSTYSCSDDVIYVR